MASIIAIVEQYLQILRERHFIPAKEFYTSQDVIQA